MLWSAEPMLVAYGMTDQYMLALTTPLRSCLLFEIVVLPFWANPSNFYTEGILSENVKGLKFTEQMCKLFYTFTGF